MRKRDAYPGLWVVIDHRESSIGKGSPPEYDPDRPARSTLAAGPTIHTAVTPTEANHARDNWNLRPAPGRRHRRRGRQIQGDRLRARRDQVQGFPGLRRR